MVAARILVLAPVLTGWALLAVPALGQVLTEGSALAERPTHGGKPVWAATSMEWVATGIEIFGVAIIVLGAVIASVRFLMNGFGANGSGGGFGMAYHAYRAELGRAILLGLELLVAADIIGTVAIDPSFESLGVLAGIVVIRTFLSVSLEVEIEGRWPWQSRPRGEPERV